MYPVCSNNGCHSLSSGGAAISGRLGLDSCPHPKLGTDGGERVLKGNLRGTTENLLVS